MDWMAVNKHEVHARTCKRTNFGILSSYLLEGISKYDKKLHVEYLVLLYMKQLFYPLHCNNQTILLKQIRHNNLNITKCIKHGSMVVKALCYKLEGRRFNTK
jgi:hypothetical protein